MILRAEKIAKWYYRKSGESNRFFTVSETDIQLESGSLTVLMGRSGSGKTTFLHMLGGLLIPDAGKVWVDDKDLYAMNDAELSRYRNQHIGIISQGHTAVQSLSVLENVMLPQVMYGDKDGGTGLAGEWLTRFGMQDLQEAFPSELSGGELRRMSIARALAGKPEILLADEPTGDLDDENTQLVMKALREAADEGTAVLVVTHESDALDYADQRWQMNAGVLTK